MVYVVFFVIIAMFFGGILLYGGVKLCRHPRWLYKILGGVLIFSGVAVSSYAVQQFFERSKDEDELAALYEKAAEAARSNEPSSLEVRRDAGTGCQYLVAPNGSLTPRLDSTGKQVCK